MEKLTWKKTQTKIYGFKSLECEQIDLSIHYDKIEKTSLSYDIIYNGRLVCIMWRDTHIIEGE